MGMVFGIVLCGCLGWCVCGWALMLFLVGCVLLCGGGWVAAACSPWGLGYLRAQPFIRPFHFLFLQAYAVFDVFDDDF